MLYIIILLIIIFDQVIKLIVTNTLSYGQSVVVINEIFHLTYVRNRGAGFGILQGQRTLFIIITIIIIIVLYLYRQRTEKNRYLDIAMALIIGGAIGNLIDRIRLHYVIDYLDFRIWPVFNLADSAVVVGVGILLIYLWKYDDNTGDTGDMTLEDDKNV
ncbi:MAG: signal peptidase II [bacterium]